MKYRLISGLLVLASLFLLTLTACGGGGGGDNSGGNENESNNLKEQVVVDMTLTGSENTIGSIYLELELPQGFALPIDGEGSLAAGVLSTNLTDAYLQTSYFPETNLDYGRLQIVLIKANGFSPGKFCTLVRDLGAGGSPPLPEEFTVTTLTATDLNGIEIPDYEITISVQSQEVLQ